MTLTLEERAASSRRQTARRQAKKNGQPAPAPAPAVVPAAPPVVFPRPSQWIPFVTERPTGAAARAPRGVCTVKPFDELPPLVQELVKTGGNLATAKLVRVPLTRAQLESERASLEREADIIERRLRQIDDELLNLRTAA